MTPEELLTTIWAVRHRLDLDRPVDLLGIPETVTQLTLLPAAYTRGAQFSVAQRRAVEEVTYGNRWKNPV